ncbi:hypothetical protein J8I87_33965, partial [Paraburkholderia sp. LEh10]|uniref:hypothetical protein n=1 Tax=Paraburkholderia sp. LEh10 TaxID=2821353 RepID=UPI001AE611EF
MRFALPCAGIRDAVRFACAGIRDAVRFALRASAMRFALPCAGIRDAVRFALRGHPRCGSLCPARAS